MIESTTFQILEDAYETYARPEFIADDPISIPHQFSNKEDIEIAGFLTATIAWGNRKAILKAANHLMELMHHQPAEFVLNHGKSDLKLLEKYYYRTFQAVDIQYFIKSLKNIYTQHQGLESIFNTAVESSVPIENGLKHLHQIFFELEHPARTLKHLANIGKGASAKRLNMFLRWMVRKDDKGVDFGIWKSIPASALHCPLDVHSARTARHLGLLKRKSNDWKAVIELTDELKKYDPEDPVKYDFALFGLSVQGDL